MYKSNSANLQHCPRHGTPTQPGKKYGLIDATGALPAFGACSLNGVNQAYAVRCNDIEGWVDRLILVNGKFGYLPGHSPEGRKIPATERVHGQVTFVFRDTLAEFVYFQGNVPNGQ